MGFSERIKKVRSILGLSQSEMGKLIDVNQNSYCSYEKGNRRPSIEKLAILSQIGISIGWLVDGNINLNACTGIRNAIIENTKEVNERIAERLDIPYELLIAFTNKKISPSVQMYEKIKGELNIIDLSSNDIENIPLREIIRRIGELEHQLMEWQKRHTNLLKENAELKAKLAVLEVGKII